VLLSEKPIKLPAGTTDIKKIANIDWIRREILKNDVMLGLVLTKASGGDPKTGGNFSLDFLVDVSKQFYLRNAEAENSFSKFYVYHLESLGVGLREYRTIRMSEFFGMA
jgi:hypothetical protein